MNNAATDADKGPVYCIVAIQYEGLTALVSPIKAWVMFRLLAMMAFSAFISVINFSYFQLVAIPTEKATHLASCLQVNCQLNVSGVHV